MAVETQPEFKQAASARFPGAAPITGTGRFAVLFRCTDQPSVVLYEFAIEARQVASDKCSHAFCRMEHFAVELKPAAQYQRPRFRRIHMDD